MYMQDSKNVLDEVTKGDYKYGFVTESTDS